MTATVVLEAIDNFGQTLKSAKLNSLVKITPCATGLVGTSAQILVSDLLTIEELLYGMMLPSGNDAA
jgi:D-alanyl-D-alanine carboxypeptidase